MRIEIDPQIFLTYRAKDIQTRMNSNPICIDVNEKPEEALRRLVDNSFDQAPVVSESIVIGWILTSNLQLTSSISDSMIRLSPSDLISSEAPLNDLLARLVKQQLIFLVGVNGIDGFVVRSDIGRHVSRAHLYLMISGFEIIMTKIVSRDFADSEPLVSLMSKTSREAWESDRKRGFDANPVEYLDLRGLGKALAKLKGPLIHVGTTEANWKTFVEIMSSIRNWVAHSNTEQLVKHPFFDVVEKVQLTEKYIYKLNKY